MKSFGLKLRYCLVQIVSVAIFFLIVASGASSVYSDPIPEGQTKFLGNIVGSSIPTDFSKYWNQVTPENSGKWGNVERSRGTMNWTPLKTAYDFAKQNGYPFKHHTFVWGQQQPSWIDSITPEEQKEEIEEFIKLYAENFPNTDYADVVNEPLNAPASYREALGGAGSTGWDWVVWTFEKARLYLPNTKLLINEWGIVSDPVLTEKYLEIIKILQEKNLVDGIGVQSHCFNLQDTKPEVIKSNLDKLAATGLPVFSSEFDLQGDDEVQKQRYQQYFPIFWEHPGVKGVTIWGYRYNRTWKETTWLIDSTGADRQALSWLLSYVSSAAALQPGIAHSSKSKSILNYCGDGIVNVRSTEPVQLELFTAHGTKIRSLMVQGNTPLSLASLNTPNGVYLLRVNHNSTIRVRITR